MKLSLTDFQGFRSYRLVLYKAKQTKDNENQYYRSGLGGEKEPRQRFG
jgi:hypothetical protein